MNHRIETPLRILIVDSNHDTARDLKQAIARTRWGEWVERTVHVSSLSEATEMEFDSGVNTIFIDPVAFGIEQASRFIFAVRDRIPTIVFVLFCDPEAIEANAGIFYSGERKRFHHYYHQSKTHLDTSPAGALETTLWLCMSDVRQNHSASLTQQRLQLLSQQSQPIEIADSTKRFRARFPQDGHPVGFLMMRFSKERTHLKIAERIRKELDDMGLITVRADDHTFHDHLLYNVLTYAHGCDFGVAVIDRIEDEHHNPNVALEVGYMLALRKPICLLRDKSLKTPQTDLTGMLSVEFDVSKIKGMGKSLRKWVSGQEFFKRMRPNEISAERSASTSREADYD